jgi:hypothetical protein
MARPFEEIVLDALLSYVPPTNDEVKVSKLNQSCTIAPICT